MFEGCCIKMVLFKILVFELLWFFVNFRGFGDDFLGWLLIFFLDLFWCLLLFDMFGLFIKFMNLLVEFFMF